MCALKKLAISAFDLDPIIGNIYFLKFAIIQQIHEKFSAVNLILKLNLVNWKAITGRYQLTGYCVQVQHLSLIISVFNINTYS